MSSKTVRFGRDSPSGGSYLDHQRSDSGVGSFSDSESRSPFPDRAFAGSDIDVRDFYELQHALNTETLAKQRWMEKATELDALLRSANTELKETEARLRALEDHLDELEEEKAKLIKKNKEVTDEVASLKEGLKDEAKEKDKEAKKSSSSSSRRERKSSSPPLMSGALNGDEEKKSRPSRRESKRHSIRDSERAEREKERERIHREIEKEMEREKERQQERDMDRLRKRFDKGDESDARSSNTSSKSHRSRRDSYVEPLGQPSPRPQVAPPSPSRQYAYSSNSYPQQSYAPAAAPRVPVVHPQVVVSYNDAFHDEEDGLYHPHPLPNKTRGSDRRR